MSLELVPLPFLKEVDVWQVLGILAKTFTYGASFMAAGGVLFLLMFGRRLAADESRPIQRTVMWAAIGGILFSLLRLSTISAMMTGDFSGLLDVAMIKMVIESSEGPATGVRVLGLLCVAVATARSRLAGGRSARSARRARGARSAVALAGAFIAVCSFALVGHAGEVAMGPRVQWLPQLLICLHLIAVAFWLGALWPLHRLTFSPDLRTTAEISRRFGEVAMAIVGLLVVCGVWLLWLILGAPSALWTSQYGRVFMVKFLGVAGLLALGAANKLIFTPRLFAGQPSAAKGLRLSIRFEMLVAALVLLASAVLTTAIGPAETS